jgi:hypothetical protein
MDLGSARQPVSKTGYGGPFADVAVGPDGSGRDRAPRLCRRTPDCLFQSAAGRRARAEKTRAANRISACGRARFSTPCTSKKTVFPTNAKWANRRAPTCTYVRSALIFYFACWPVTWSGTCANAWCPFSSIRMTSVRYRPRARPLLRRHNAPHPANSRLLPSTSARSSLRYCFSQSAHPYRSCVTFAAARSTGRPPISPLPQYRSRLHEAPSAAATAC